MLKYKKVKTRSLILDIIASKEPIGASPSLIIKLINEDRRQPMPRGTITVMISKLHKSGSIRYEDKRYFLC